MLVVVLVYRSGSLIFECFYSSCFGSRYKIGEKELGSCIWARGREVFVFSASK